MHYQVTDVILDQSPDMQHRAAVGWLSPGTLTDKRSVTVSVKHAAHCPEEPPRFEGKRRLGPTLLQDTKDQFQAPVASQSPTDSISMGTGAKRNRL